MDNELKEALTALLKAELSPVIERLDRIDGRLDGRYDDTVWTDWNWNKLKSNKLYWKPMKR